MPKTMRLLPALLVSAVVALGIGAAWGTLALWFYSTISSTVHRGNEYEQLYLSADGEPLIVRVSRESAATRRVLGLDGKPRQVTTQDLLYPPYIHTPDQLSPVAAANWNYRIAATNDSGLPPIYWYLVNDGRHPGRAFGIGYNSQTKMVVGYFATRGFTESMPPRDDWFRILGHHGLFEATNLSMGAREPTFANAQPHFLLLAGGKLWQVDLVQRQVKELLDCPLALSLGQAWKLTTDRLRPVPGTYPVSAQEYTPMVTIVRQPESLLLIDQLADTRKEYPLPAPLRNKAIAAALLTDGNLLTFALQSPMDATYEVAWLSPAGDIINQQHVELTAWSRQPSLAEIGWVAAAAAPLPIASAVVVSVLPRWLIYNHPEQTFSSALGEVLSHIWLGIAVVLVVSTLAAWYAYRRQKRFGLRHAAAWAGFVFLFGLPGYLAYRFHRPWPVLEECPACHQPSPRDRQSCLDCGASFPPPPLKGIEVFA